MSLGQSMILLSSLMLIRCIASHSFIILSPNQTPSLCCFTWFSKHFVNVTSQVLSVSYRLKMRAIDISRHVIPFIKIIVVLVVGNHLGSPNRKIKVRLPQHEPNDTVNTWLAVLTLSFDTIWQWTVLHGWFQIWVETFQKNNFIAKTGKNDRLKFIRSKSKFGLDWVRLSWVKEVWSKKWWQVANIKEMSETRVIDSR
jgi:hypothetical protein